MVEIKIAEAFVELRVDGRRAQVDAETAARSAAQSAAGMFAQFFTAKVAIDQFVSLKNAASDLEQAVGGTEAQFGEAAATIDRFAQTSAQAMGLSEAAFRQLTTQVGGLLQGLGFAQEEAAEVSSDLAQMGADLAATYGGTTREAVEALGAAIRGEFDPLERFGVSLRVSQINAKAVEMGLADTTTAVDANARATAALALITEQTANVQGQFGREAETTAGREAILTAELENQRAEIGQQLMPVYIMLLEMVSALAGAFAELPSPVQAGIVAMLGIAAVALPIANVVRALGGISTALASLRVAMAAHPLLTIAGILAGVTIAMGVFSGGTDEAKVSVDDLANSMRDLQDPLEGMVGTVAQLANDNPGLLAWIDATGLSFRQVAEAALAGDNAMGTLIIAGNMQAAAAGNQVEFNDALQNTLLGLVPAADAAREKYEAMTRASDEAAAAAEEQTDKTSDTTTAVGHASDAERDYVASLLDANEAARDAARAREEEATATEEAARVAEEAAAEYQAWSDSINAAFSSGRGAVSDFTDEAMADLDLWQEELANDIMAIALWQDNIARIGAETSPEFAAYLAEMGLAGAGLVQEMATNGGELAESFGLWTEATNQASRDIVAEIQGLAGEMGAEGNAIGAALAAGMAAGIDANAAHVGNRAAAAARNAAVAARNAMGIASPSKVMAELVGLPMVQGIAQGIIDGTPAAAIAAALAAGEISEEMADQLREELSAEEEGRRMAERVGNAIVDELEAQRDAVLDAAEALVDAAADRLSGLWDAVGGQFSLEDVREAVSDQERAVADARAKLAEVREDPEATARDRADAAEALSDAERRLERDNYRLFQLLLEQNNGAVTLDALAAGRAAGLTDAQIWEIRNQGTALTNAESSLASATANFAGVAFAPGEVGNLATALSSAVRSGLANVTFEIDGQVIDVRVSDLLGQYTDEQMAGA